MNVNWTTKNIKCDTSGFSLVKCLLQCFVLQDPVRTLVQDIDNCVLHAFAQRHMGKSMSWIMALAVLMMDLFFLFATHSVVGCKVLSAFS
jgi:hypothetical protein